MSEDSIERRRLRMVEEIAIHAHLAAEEIGKAELDDRAMAVMAKVPRHEFVPPPIRPYAYLDGPLPIGYEKTISQPFMVALMTDLLALDARDVVLEVGTGLGYHAAVLAELAARVYSVEIVEELGMQAQLNLRRLGYANVESRIGNGAKGWPEHAPFDKIVCGAAAELIPTPLLDQLAPRGRMVLPVGLENDQRLMVVEKAPDGRLSTRQLMAVRFTQLEVYH
jgi:protein-L-isoaspartate(D-aspartate) O-methyltransferase